VVNPPLAEGRKVVEIALYALGNVLAYNFFPKTLFELECSYNELRHKDW
jgi:hypothetical protein